MERGAAQTGQERREVEFIARGLMIRSGRALLCRNLKHGYTYLPGGHVEFGEGAEAACRREFLEETGLAVVVGECVLVCEARFTQSGRDRHEVTAVFLVEHPGWEPPVPGDTPPAVPSLERKIGFEWAEIAEMGGAGSASESDARVADRTLERARRRYRPPRLDQHHGIVGGERGPACPPPRRIRCPQ